VVQATFKALQQLQDFRQEAQRRGVDPARLAPFWYKEENNYA
jgi:ribosomal protein S5